MKGRRWIGAALGAAIALAVVPRTICGRDAAATYRGAAAAQARLAAGVAAWIEGDVSHDDFANMSSRKFSGEWAFGSHMMAGMGFGQTALEHPEWKADHLAKMDRCIDRILDDDLRAFDAESWNGEDPIESLDGPNDHAAYLGYLNLLLSLRRTLDRDGKHAALNDRITAALVKRLEAAPHGLLATYPGEGYPVDNAAGVASIALHARALGKQTPPVVAAWIARCRKSWIDPKTGLLVQAVSPDTGDAVDEPRGSGTFYASYFLSFTGDPLAAELHRAGRDELLTGALGFGLMREYARGTRGRGDVDSGPVIFGIGISPTGFALGSARAHGDEATYRALYRSAWLGGSPRDEDGVRHWQTGGPLGDSLLFALMTAPRMTPPAEPAR